MEEKYAASSFGFSLALRDLVPAISCKSQMMYLVTWWNYNNYMFFLDITDLINNEFILLFAVEGLNINNRDHYVLLAGQ